MDEPNFMASIDSWGSEGAARKPPSSPDGPDHSVARRPDSIFVGVTMSPESIKVVLPCSGEPASPFGDPIGPKMHGPMLNIGFTLEDRDLLERITAWPMSATVAMIAMALNPARRFNGIMWHGGTCVKNENGQRYRLGVSGDTITLITAPQHMTNEWEPADKMEGIVFTLGDLET